MFRGLQSGVKVSTFSDNFILQNQTKVKVIYEDYG